MTTGQSIEERKNRWRRWVSHIVTSSLCYLVDISDPTVSTVCAAGVLQSLVDKQEFKDWICFSSFDLCNIYLNCLPAPFPVLGVLRQSPHDEVGLERLRPKDVISGKNIFVNHKPYDKAELRRIKRAGHTVDMQRVDGDLALSRAFGDFNYKDKPKLKPQ